MGDIFEDADKAKAALANLVLKELAGINYSELETCDLLGISQKEYDNLMAGDLEDICLFRFLKFLNALNRDIYITIFPPSKGTSGKIRIGHFDISDDDTDSFLSEGSLKVVADI